jgi:HSP20 family protein
MTMLSRNTSNGHLTHPLLRDFDALFRDLARPSFGFVDEARALAPAADIRETDAGLTLQLDMPGHDPKALQVKVEDQVLTVRSERKGEERSEKDGYLRVERAFGVYERSFRLPPNVDTGRVDAKYEHGVLTLSLPRREETRARTIEVKVA